MKVVLITGLSGSGKSVALRALEDASFYCVDNLPPGFIPEVLQRLQKNGTHSVAIAVDARVGKDIALVPGLLATLKAQGMDARVVFLEADSETLATRYSETRRRHPMSSHLGDQATVMECIAAERQALGPLRQHANTIDSSGLQPNLLRRWVLETVEQQPARLTLVLETFGFKHGLPFDADLVFDVRCLTNPYYDPNLRPLTGKDPEVAQCLQADPRSAELIADIERYLRRWLPDYLNEQRSYFTVAIGCTGGQHRSVFVAEQLAKRLSQNKLAEVDHLLLRHRSLG